MYDLLENTDPLRTASLAARLSPDVRITVARFSPASNIGRLRTPLFIMHSENDPAAPLTEAAKLHRTVAGSRLIVLHYYLHVSPPGQGTPIGGYVADGWGGLEFTSWVLGAQE